MKKRTRIFLGIAFFAAATTPILAQQSSDGPFVLHEFVTVDGNGRTDPPAKTRTREPGNPPPLSMEANRNEPILDPDGPKFDQALSPPYGDLTPFGSPNTLDDRTDRVSSLNYFAQFEPSVIPYKRVVAQNKIDLSSGDYKLSVESDRLTPQSLRAPGNDESKFWGSFLIRSDSKRLHPIPSVSPGQKIVQIQTEPQVDIEVLRDEADNYFLRIPSDVLVRINMQLSVPNYYFSGEFTDIEWHEFDASLIPEVPSEVKYVAYKVAQKIGATRDQRARTVLTTMVEYFRNFEAKPFERTDRERDLYETIASEQIGVCRHRSLAFVITAQALGIPTRYVYNEAHAFVEVHWPGAGWRRIDLGGAADEMNAAIDDGRSIHNAGEDALPTPERYIREQQNMRQNFPEGVNPTSEENNGTSENGAQGGTNNGAGNGAEFSEIPPDDRRSARITIDKLNTEVKRGGLLTIRAQLTDDTGSPLNARNLLVFLGPVGQTSRAEAIALGRGRTGSEGIILESFQIPPDHAIGRWEVFVYFPGDETFRPAIGD